MKERKHVTEWVVEALPSQEAKAQRPKKPVNAKASAVPVTMTENPRKEGSKSALRTRRARKVKAANQGSAQAPDNPFMVLLED